MRSLIISLLVGSMIFYLIYLWRRGFWHRKRKKHEHESPRLSLHYWHYLKRWLPWNPTDLPDEFKSRFWLATIIAATLYYNLFYSLLYSLFMRGHLLPQRELTDLESALIGSGGTLLIFGIWHVCLALFLNRDFKGDTTKYKPVTWDELVLMTINDRLYVLEDGGKQILVRVEKSNNGFSVATKTTRIGSDGTIHTDVRREEIVGS